MTQVPNTGNLKKSQATSRKINLPVATKQKTHCCLYQSQIYKALVERSLLIPIRCPLPKHLSLQTKVNSCLILQDHSYVFIGWGFHRVYVEKLMISSSKQCQRSLTPGCRGWGGHRESQTAKRQPKSLSVTRLWQGCDSICKSPCTSLLHRAASELVIAAWCHRRPTGMMNSMKQATGPPLSRAHEEFPNSILSLQGQGKHPGCFRGRCRRARVTQGAVAIQICCSLQ